MGLGDFTAPGGRCVVGGCGGAGVGEARELSGDEFPAGGEFAGYEGASHLSRAGGVAGCGHEEGEAFDDDGGVWGGVGAEEADLRVAEG